MKTRLIQFVLAFAIVMPSLILAQAPNQGSQVSPAPLPPATKLEAFNPAAGSVVTLGYDELGRIGPGFSTPGLVLVELRQLKAAGDSVQGMTVTISEGQNRDEMAFVDEDEMLDLVRGVDALINLKSNPTRFKNFEVRYLTKGDLMLIAFNNSKGEVQYAIQAGRVFKSKRFINLNDLQKIRAMFQVAADRLTPKGQ